MDDLSDLTRRSILPLTGMILCGGQSSRMGTDKSQLAFAGGTLLEHCCRQIAAVTNRVVVVAAQQQSELQLPPDVDIVRDEWPDRGPLAGFLSGLNWLQSAAANAPIVLLTTCDMPFVTSDVVAILSENLRGSDSGILTSVIRSGDQLHPFPGIYRLAVRSAAETLLESGSRSMQRLLEGVTTAELPEEKLAACGSPDQILLNVNTPDDLQKARQIIDG